MQTAGTAGGVSCKLLWCGDIMGGGGEGRDEECEEQLRDGSWRELVKRECKLMAWDDGRFRDGDGPTLTDYLSFVGDSVVEEMQAVRTQKTTPVRLYPVKKEPQQAISAECGWLPQYGRASI